jgi:hypothetical protein
MCILKLMLTVHATPNTFSTRRFAAASKSLHFHFAIGLQSFNVALQPLYNHITIALQSLHYYFAKDLKPQTIAL